MQTIETISNVLILKEWILNAPKLERNFKGSKIQRKEILIVLELKRKWILNAFKCKKTNVWLKNNR